MVIVEAKYNGNKSHRYIKGEIYHIMIFKLVYEKRVFVSFKHGENEISYKFQNPSHIKIFKKWEILEYYLNDISNRWCKNYDNETVNYMKFKIREEKISQIIG